MWPFWLSGHLPLLVIVSGFGVVWFPMNFVVTCLMTAAVVAVFASATPSNAGVIELAQAASDADTKVGTIPASKGHFVTYDFTNETDTEALADAPGSTSNDRLSVVVRGGNDRIKDAVHFAGRKFAERVHDVSYLEMRDNDSETKDALIEFCAEGYCYNAITVGVDADQTLLIKAVYQQLLNGYKIIILPNLAE